MRPELIILIATAALAAPAPPPIPPSAVQIPPEVPCDVERRDVSQEANIIERDEPMAETAAQPDKTDKTEDGVINNEADVAKQLEACLWFGAPVGQNRDNWNINHCLRRPKSMCTIL